MRKVREYKYCRYIVVSIFSFLLGCMITLNLTPIDKTCIIDNADKEYNIMQNSKLRNPELIVIVLSAPKNLEKRRAIRETWLKMMNEESKYRAKHYFVIGSLGLSHDEILHLSTEQSQFGDILVLPIRDSYKNLSMKVLKTFEWLTEQYDYGLGYKYALKCDDDSFVNLKALLMEIPKMEYILSTSSLQYPLHLPPEKLNNFITTNVQSNQKWNFEVVIANMSIYWGYFNGNAKIKTSGKWKESEWITCDQYTPYALGGGYILSKELISFIGRNAKILRTFTSEDISVGLWLSGVNDLIRVHDIRFDTEWTTRGCKNYHLISHNVSPKTMREMYEHLLSNKQLCAIEIENRKYYLYNWSLPPTQCCKPSSS